MRRAIPGTAAAGRAAALIRQPLYRNALFIWGNSVTAAVGGLAFWTAAARLFSAQAVGLGSATSAAFALLGTITHLGLGSALVRWLPSMPARRTALINTALTLAALAAAALAGIYLLGIRLWSPGLAYLDRGPWYAAGFVLFTVAAAAGIILNFVYVGLRDARHVFTMSAVQQVARLVICLPLALAGGFGIAAANGVAGVIGVGLGLWLLPGTERSYASRPVLDWKAVGQLVPFGVANQLADLALVLPGLALPIVVINTLGPTSSAHFYVGYFMGALLTTASQSLGTSLFAEGSASPHELARSAWHALGWSLAATAMGAAALCLAAPWVLLIFGSGYAGGATNLVRLVAVGALPGSATYIAMSVLRVRHRLLELIAVGWIVCATTLISSQLLMLRLGILGAGVGVLIGQSAGALICLGGVVWAHMRRATAAGGAVHPTPASGDGG